MSKIIKFYFIFLLVVIPLTCLAKEGRQLTKKFGNYSVTISKITADDVEGKITITKDNIKVFEEKGLDAHYFFGNEFDENDKRISLGKNITGNGVPNLIITKWTGGAHCCNFLYVFELGNKFRQLTEVVAQSSPIWFKDIDGDGIPEIEFGDGAIDYDFASFAGSPAGRVILKFTGNKYEMAISLMKKHAPTKKQWNIFKTKIFKGFKEESPDLPYDLLEPMMDLSYSGHLDLALKLADETRPKNKPNLLEFKKNFQAALQNSQYWKKF